MFSTTLTNPKAFGATYQWAILSVLPMDTDKTRHGLGPSEINKELGMPKEARTTMSLLLKELAAKGIVKRYEYRLGRRRVSYKRILPLRKRERFSRFIFWGWYHTGQQCPFFLIFVTGNRFYLHPSTPGVTRNLVIIIRNNLVIIRIVNDDWQT